MEKMSVDTSEIERRRGLGYNGGFSIPLKPRRNRGVSMQDLYLPGRKC